jgi:hypothetical protein
MKIKEKYYRFAEKGQQIQRVNRFFVTEYPLVSKEQNIFVVHAISMSFVLLLIPCKTIAVPAITQ